MQTTTCDICKKKIEDPVTGRTFFYFAEHSICEPCKDNLDDQLRTALRGKDPFTYEWFDKVVGDNISKSISKGK
ncbi:MAG: hypothetical protein FWB86_12460 [Treponema sp.]|nr:hypothetical protein [Treponema sp.]MCL2250336.1 hypothetical protein [Treponema sp.]